VALSLERFAQSADPQSTVGRMQVDEDATRRAILEVNDAFYHAFEALDVDALDLVWADRTYTAVVHPGREMLRGWAEVRESWKEIFTGTERIRFRLSDVNLEVRGRLAYLLAHEHIRHGDDVLVSLQATNIFELIDGRWRMILHHASPISDDAGEPDTDYLQ
jgi:ketosteroid isomerase-like protein